MVQHHRYLDPCNLRFDKDGQSLDGRLFGAVYGTQISTPNLISYVEVDPSLCTIDYFLYELTEQRQFKSTSSMEHCSSLPTDILAWQWGTSSNIVMETITKKNSLQCLEGPLSLMILK
jgi:hypothetical protein